jgi:hypothetical protein
MSVQLQQILTITGESGLFRALSFNKRGVIVESIDDKKIQTLKSTVRNQIVCLIDISIYATDDNGTIPLNEIFASMYLTLKEGIGLELLSNKEKLRDLFYTIVPKYDAIRVKDHEIKKIATWYNILIKYYPELFHSAPNTRNIA